MANLSNLNNKFLVTTGGNVLINKTAANNSTVGTQIMSTGDVNATVSGDTVARFNRLGTDGEIIRFQHDTSTDGAINSSSGRIAIGSSTTGIFFDSIRDVVTPHNMSTNTYSTNISLGRSVIPFKDLYLGGSAVFVDGAAYSSAASIRQQSSALIFSGGSTGYYFNKSDNSATHMFINSSGNVGIGTTSPSAPLTIERATNSNEPSLYLDTVGGGAGSVGLGNSSAIGPFLMGNTNPDGTVRGAYGGSRMLFNAGGFTFQYSDETSGARTFDTKMVINSSGNVGIGTTSPGVKLEIQDSTHTTMKIRSGNNDNILFAQALQSDEARIGTDTNSAISFFTNTSRRMTITTSGNVGIGTNLPTAKLEIVGSNGTNIFRGNFAGSADIFMGFDNANPYLTLQDNSNVTTHLFQSNVNNYIVGSSLGIGTTSPGALLEINGVDDSGATDLLRLEFDNSPADTGITFTNLFGAVKNRITMESNNTDKLMISAAHSIEFSTNTTSSNTNQRLTIANGGDVGIGTTSPNEKLTVAGNVNITGTGALLRWNSGDIQIRNAGSYAMAFDTYSGSALVERMRIISGGYIGMNTSPSGFATLEIENIASTTYGLYVDYIDTNASYGAMKVILTGASTSPSYVDWWYGATQTGAVVTTGSSTQYLTSSDYRLKENIIPMSNAIDRVKQLKPSRFNFIGHENTVDGLIAHEVAEVVPEAVNGEKDGLRDDGTPKYQGIDEGKLVPLLIGAIQELEAEIELLKNK